ncbi:MAG TPA: MXAN_2562 family outer membrane beta-barrel protein [Anaeromyxobacteraceae bacterium]|nr:MXAN_2562 family outer membrane beta-barrel protein [Anaeromyxobacteraceae bacterium]
MNALRALSVAALLLPLAAAADSPKWGTFELRVANYRPDIDSEFGGAKTPYADAFGTKRGWFPRALASWTLLDRFVQVDAGAGTGWFRAKGKGQYRDPATGAWVASGDNTTFSIIPATLALTVRVDGVADRWPIPLDVYGRVALERYHWLVTDGAGSVTEKGATNGWSVAGGVGLLLNFVDPMLGRELDADSGVNQTWLFFEVERSRVDDFGSTRSWNLSDEKLTMAGGLRLVF